MFSSKLEIDRHVDNCLKKITSETERNLRCLSFAKLYFGICEYELARRYVSTYLSTKPLSAEGQLLLGKTLEKLGKKGAALEAYKASLDVDPKQNNVIIKVCELLSSDDVNFDAPAAKYYCEKAQSFDPHNPAVFALKERLIASENKDPAEVTQFLLRELETRPTDVKLRIKLLRHLLQNNQVKEAYKHAMDIEEKSLSIFLSNISWYETVAEVLVLYQKSNTLNQNLGYDFWILIISVLDKLVSLSLDERSDNIKSSTECVAAVFNFDQTLKVASQNLVGSERQVVQEFLNHFRGQLCFHLATLLFKQAKKGLIRFKEATNLCLPLLFSSYHAQPADLTALWLNQVTERKREQIRRWHKEAAFRCSQSGHILLAMAKDRKVSLLEKAILHSSGMWREQLFKKLFVTRDQQNKISSSYFTSCSQLVDVVVRIPEEPDLVVYDEQAQFIYPDSLHHYIWLCNNSDLSQFKLTAYAGLRYSVKHLNNCSAESLNVLDVQTFIYCAALCAKAHADNLRHLSYSNERPAALPAAVTEQLGTLNQSKWLTAAYKMYRNEYGSELGEVRLTLIKGIEVVRCVGNHGLDVKLLVQLAATFSELAKTLTKQSEIEFTEARAELYWRTALPLLEKLSNNQTCIYTGPRLFDYKAKELTLSDIQMNMDKAKLFLATQQMKRKDYERALQTFEGLKDPYASYHQGQIYKNMAAELANQNKDNMTTQLQNQHSILLTKARDCFYLTLDRLRDPSVDRKHPLNAQLGEEIEKIERILTRSDLDLSNRNECDGMSDENESIPGSGEPFTSFYSVPNSSFLNGSVSKVGASMSFSTPLRKEARPSPERLDAQLRQLATTTDSAITHILDQIRLLVDSHRSLVEEFRGIRNTDTNLTKHTVEELKGIKESVNELKNSVEELQSFRDVTDVVYELKKELSELKKDAEKSKSSQLTDEDLYPLVDNFGAAYFEGSNISGLGAGVYHQGRIPAPNAMGYPQPAYIPYPVPYHLGLPQAGTLPFSPEQQLAELRAINTLSQNLNQSGLASHSYGQPLLPPPLSQPFNQSLLPPTALPQPGLMTGQPAPQQNLFKDPTFAASNAPTVPAPTTSIFTSFQPQTVPSVLGPAASSKAPPVNVVITASDPLPTSKPAVSQPILSVTIPPQHLKGNQQKPHNYQIPLPATSTVAVTSTPSVLKQSPMPVTTQNILYNVAPPVYSAIPTDKSPNKSTGLGLQIEKTLSQSFSSTTVNDSNIDLNRSNKSNTSVSSVEEHDPCPDFKPIIPLPDEVPVNTGEENEVVMFCERAKLFRYTDKEWKERGVGNIKILKNPETGKIRILMRRDQIHKICANHFLTKDMVLSPMPNSDKAYMWAANDFADEEVVLEKLAVRFKTIDQAAKFCRTFEEAKLELKEEPAKAPEKPRDTITPAKTAEANTAQAANTASLGGFVFTSTPTFKPKEDEVTVEPEKPEVAKPSPFAGFSFDSKSQVEKKETTQASPFANFSFGSKPVTPSSASFADFKPVTTPPKVTPVTSPPKVTPASPSAEESATEFVPTAEFKPVVPLPDVIDVKTGEEGSEVLLELRGKLLRYDTDAKEWKERGLGMIKILKEENLIRLLMRREQVHKVCCNHQLLKSMSFTKMANCPKAVTWYAQDYAEEVLKPEMFAIRFKTQEQADEFHKAIIDAQNSLNENNTLTKQKTPEKRNQHAKVKTEPEPPAVNRQTSWGDKFKPKSGTWECKNCYIHNDGKENYCVACETPKNDTIPKKGTTGAKPEQTFSFGVPAFTGGENKASFVFGTPPPTQGGKVTVGFGEPAKSEESESNKAATGFGDLFKPKAGSWTCTVCYVSNDAAKIQCAACDTPKEGSTKATPGPKGFGDQFKPKEGSWTCKECLVPNDGVKTTCVSCESPRDGATPKSDGLKGINLDTPGLKFTFGIPSQKPFVFTPPATESQTEPAALSKSKPVIFKASEPVNEEQKVLDEESKDKFVFGSPQKHDFEFIPRSPRRHSGGQDEESDGSYVEEEADNIYFKPVIPLPDKVDVKTGEEQEDVLYCHRAKLFRFVQGEWKERGIGDVKILFRPDTKKLRVVMRREQVLKICLNHVLTPEIEYLPKDDKTWLFSAADFSEGEINHQQFCIRFKTPELAQEFKKHVDDALKRIAGDSDTKTEKTDTDTDIEVVFETKVTPEEEKEAKRLGLPPKFLAYRQKAKCTCEQCKKDDEYLKDWHIEKDTKPSVGTPTSAHSPFTTPQLSTPHLLSPLNQSSLAGGDQSATLKTPEDKDKSGSLRDLLIKPPAFVSPVTPKKEETPAKTEQSSVFNTFSFSLNTTPQTPTSSIFSNSPAPAKSFSFTNTPIFGTGASSQFSTANPVFGSTTASQNATALSGSIFSTPQAATTTASVFGNTSIFNSDAARTPSVFGSSGTSLFGGTPFGTPKNEKPTDSIFGSTNKGSMPTFGSLIEKKGEEKADIEKVLPCDSNLSFATLAAANPEKPAFAKAEGDNSTPFSFLGAGAPVFGAAKSKPTKKEDKDKQHSGDEAEGDAGADEEYDPHYEPIVPLPAAIVVSTGEEDENVLFNERAKLFRFNADNKEWKERGVGQMKLLHHPINNTYRLLLRREQVHKVVLNQLITADLDLQPMTTSDKAWLWGGYNYTDDDAALEKLAARFKTTDLAQRFYAEVNKAIAAVKEIQENKSNLPATIQNYGLEDVSEDEHHHAVDEGEDDDYDDEDDTRSTLIIKHCSLSEQMPNGEWQHVADGDLEICYEMYGASIRMVGEDQELIANTIISVDTVMEQEDNYCMWRGSDLMYSYRSLKAEFDSQSTAEEFYVNYQEALSYVHKVVTEDVPTGEEEDSDDDTE